ncbi:DNA primase [Hydrogenoanaerobacterium saccharovorans]|uniref:DNA primase n=1 Tax=Hydrogenoanaerobacterium saccharovorans TaxID=474960 RepID=A0A1H8AK91_9FIRM|nr:DNA primase [Hydrogenoanaerobacterium saccharovorans]RPF47892.1 DNA primase [Hydrogenoanaerobacterium saccharovorans]SEM71175.1 DNA primase [Hydrogenoanaerobacterium saccharovorans]
MIPEQFLQELKLNNDIESVISSYIQIKRGGRNLVGLCPFHSEKTPSFTVYTDSQSFYCFGCGAGGDVISFVKRIENIEYMDALKLLADRAGMQLPDNSFDDKTAKLKSRILEINRQSARFFHSCLMSPMGKQALDYLHSRGLNDKTIRRFGLGYSPDSWDTLTKHLTSLRFTQEEIVTACVAAKGRKDNIYDQFRGRVMFPIIDIRGNVIAFGGRIMQGDGPKYLNSPDTPVFKKSRNLFALNIAKSTKEENLLLAEGYMDVIALHQAGFENAVATLGTALTDEQARLMSQYAKQIVIAYDSDGAGQTATKRAINILGEIGIQVKVLSMQGAKDPDEFIKKYGRDRFKMLIEGSSNALEFELSKIKNKYDISTADGRVNYLKEFANYIAGINNPIERDVYIAKTANDLDVSKDAVLSQVNYMIRRKAKSKEKKDAKELKVFAATPMDKVNPERGRHLKAALAEERLIAILFKNPDYCAYIKQKLTLQDFATEFNRRVFEMICLRIENNQMLDIGMFGSEFDDAQMGRIAGFIASSNGQNYTKEETDDYIQTILESKLQKTDKDVAEMNDKNWSKYISDLAAKKK